MKESVRFHTTKRQTHLNCCVLNVFKDLAARQAMRIILWWHKITTYYIKHHNARMQRPISAFIPFRCLDDVCHVLRMKISWRAVWDSWQRSVYCFLVEVCNNVESLLPPKLISFATSMGYHGLLAIDAKQLFGMFCLLYLNECHHFGMRIHHELLLDVSLQPISGIQWWTNKQRDHAFLIHWNQ